MEGWRLVSGIWVERCGVEDLLTQTLIAYAGGRQRLDLTMRLIVSNDDGSSTWRCPTHSFKGSRGRVEGVLAHTLIAYAG